jgi:hypothetical protein
MCDLGGAEPAGERQAVQQRWKERVSTLAQRQHQRQLVIIEQLGERLVRIHSEIDTALQEHGDDLLLGARCAVGQHLLEGGGHLTQRGRHRHPTDATHPG